MPEQTTADMIEEAAREGAQVVRDVLHNREMSDEQLALARIAASTISTHAKLQQVRSAQDATLVTIMGHSTESAEEFRQLVLASLPASPVAKALTEGGGNGKKKP